MSLKKLFMSGKKEKNEIDKINIIIEERIFTFMNPTYLYKMKTEETVKRIPDYSTLPNDLITIDMGGRGLSLIRQFEEFHKLSAEAIIYVIDGSKENLDNLVHITKELLTDNTIYRELYRDLQTIAIISNVESKKDEILSIGEIETLLELDKLRSATGYNVAVFKSCSRTGSEVEAAFYWVSKMVSQKRLKERLNKPIEEISQKVVKAKPKSKLGHHFELFKQLVAY